jgi:hypothetical protein
MVFPDNRRKFIRNDFEMPFFSQYLMDEDGIQYQGWDDVLARWGC